MTDTDFCGSLSRASPRMSNPIWIELDEEAAEFDERRALLEGRFGCSFHLFIEQLTKVSIVRQSIFDNQCGQLIFSTESVRSRHDSSRFSMDSVQKRSALKFTSMKSVSSFFLLYSILRGEDNFNESIVIVRCQVTAVRETREVEEQMERIDQRRLRLTNHWFDTNEQLKGIQIVGKISHSRSHSLGEQTDRPSVRHQNVFDWPRTSRERSLFSEWINAGSWAGKTSDRQSTVVRMLLPVNDIAIKAFLFFKLIILMELHSNRFECLWECSVATRRQSDSEGQGPIDVLDCWDTDLLQIKFHQNLFEEDSLLFLVTAANEPQWIVISLLH